MFVRCPPKVRVAAVRLDILTTVKGVQTSHVPRLVVPLVLLVQTTQDSDTCMNVVDVDIVDQNSRTCTKCCITLRQSTIVGDLFVPSVRVRTSPKKY